MSLFLLVLTLAAVVNAARVDLFRINNEGGPRRHRQEASIFDDQNDLRNEDMNA